MKQDEKTTETFFGTHFPSRLPLPVLEGVPEIFRPALQQGTKVHSEAVCLCSRRAQAWLDWPSRLAACRTLSDVTGAQMRFLLDMQRDYAKFLEDVLSDMAAGAEEDASEKSGQPEESDEGAAARERREAA